ncbi:MAG: hypothetical protein QME44_01690, partial [Thermodesulfobacteriota bacterium]|nr:hypothetical protein [Thermodesulfobacteriota bacterium]
MPEFSSIEELNQAYGFEGASDINGTMTLDELNQSLVKGDISSKSTTISEDEGYDVFGGLKVFAEGLTLLPKQVAATAITALQGWEGASVVDRGWGDRLVQSAQEDADRFAQEASIEYKGKKFLPGIDIKEVAQLPQNLAYSGTSMITGLGAGIGVGVATKSPMAGWASGGLASGMAAYNMASYQIMQEYLEAKNEESLQNKKRELTIDEENKLKDEFSSLAREHGLWEAIPEAAGQVLGAKIIVTPLTRMFGKTLATRIAGKLAALYGEELVTETVTQMGQQKVRYEAGLPGAEKKPEWTSVSDWGQAAKEVAPQVFLLTSVLGGAGSIAHSAYQKMDAGAKSRLIQKVVADNKYANLSDDEINTIIHEANEISKKRPKDTGLSTSIAVLNNEIKSRGIGEGAPPTAPITDTESLLGNIESSLYEGTATPEQVRASMPDLEQVGIQRQQVEDIIGVFTGNMGENMTQARTQAEQAGGDLLDQVGASGVAQGDSLGRITNTVNAIAAKRAKTRQSVQPAQPVQEDFTGQARREMAMELEADRIAKADIEARREFGPSGARAIGIEERVETPEPPEAPPMVPPAEREPYSPEFANEIARRRGVQILPPGQGFELQGPAYPISGKKGRPFQTKATATIALKRSNLERDYEVIGSGKEYFITRKAGAVATAKAGLIKISGITDQTIINDVSYGTFKDDIALSEDRDVIRKELAELKERHARKDFEEITSPGTIASRVLAEAKAKMSAEEYKVFKAEARKKLAVYEEVHREVVAPSAKIPATFIGMQENVPGKPSLVMVNEPSGTTKEFNPDVHEITNKAEYEAAIAPDVGIKMPLPAPKPIPKPEVKLTKEAPR